MTCVGCSCVGCSCVRSTESSFDSCVSSVEQAFQSGVSAIKNAPEYWVGQAKNAPAYFEEKIKNAPSFIWGQITAAPQYWTEQISALATACLMAANKAAGVDVPELQKRIKQLEIESGSGTAELRKTVQELADKVQKLGDENALLKQQVRPPSPTSPKKGRTGRAAADKKPEGEAFPPLPTPTKPLK